MRRAFVLAALLTLLLGCSDVRPSTGRNDPNWPQYQYCVSHGGSWFEDGWDGTVRCNFPDTGGEDRG